MRLCFGDSHVGLIAKALGSESDGWKFISVGGASACGILNDSSTTGARKIFFESWSPGDEVVVFLGECDIVDLLPKAPDSLTKGTTRLHKFVEELERHGSVVTVCTPLPHTSIFGLYGTPAPDLRLSIERWINALGPSLDIYSPLQGTDGFLPMELCYSIDDVGERHLNKDGYLQVWNLIKQRTGLSIGR